MPDQAYDRLTTGSKICFFLLVSLFFPIGTIFLMFFYCSYEGEPNIHEQLKEAEKGLSYSRISHENQTWFACQALTSCLYFKCPCQVDFIAKMSLAQAIRRHSEHNLPEKQRREVFLDIIQKNRYLEYVLRNINQKKPQYFFKILPSGSLREGFGKMLPSTSVLATDYDFMLVPDAIHVQPTNIVVSYDGKTSSVHNDGGYNLEMRIEETVSVNDPTINIPSGLNDREIRIDMRGFDDTAKLLANDDDSPVMQQPQFENHHYLGDPDIESEKSFINDEPAVFDALIDPTEGKKTMPDGFLWLKLNNHGLRQWKELCYPRQHSKQTEYFLSQLAVYREIRKAIGTVDENKRFFERLTDADAEDLDLVVEHNGPAVTVKVDQDEYQAVCCGGVDDKHKRKNRAYNQAQDNFIWFIICCAAIGISIWILIDVNFSIGFILIMVFGVPITLSILYACCNALCSCSDGNEKNKKEAAALRNLVKRKKLFEGDFLLALHCPEFPIDAQKEFFENRKENRCPEKVWPGQEVVKRIKRTGCHVVPKPSEKTLVFYTEEQQNNTYLAQSAVLEWRFSFSQAEILLADEVPDIARAVYIAFKATIKRHINAVSVQGVYFKLPSYVLKSIFLRQMERKPLSYWEGNRDAVTEEFFLLLFDTLEKNVETKKSILQLSSADQKKGKYVACPHYWLPTIDLLKDVGNAEVNFIQQRLKFIKAKLKYRVADNWLETQNFVRKSCCSDCYRSEIHHTLISRIQEPCKRACVCTSDGEPWQCGGPMPYNEEHFYVY